MLQVLHNRCFCIKNNPDLGIVIRRITLNLDHRGIEKISTLTAITTANIPIFMFGFTITLGSKKAISSITASLRSCKWAIIMTLEITTASSYIFIR
jgi:hypothetical protein